jgi:hypothetical protein
MVQFLMSKTHKAKEYKHFSSSFLSLLKIMNTEIDGAWILNFIEKLAKYLFDLACKFN